MPGWVGNKDRSLAVPVLFGARVPSDSLRKNFKASVQRLLRTGALGDKIRTRHRLPLHLSPLVCQVPRRLRHCAYVIIQTSRYRDNSVLFRKR